MLLYKPKGNIVHSKCWCQLYCQFGSLSLCWYQLCCRVIIDIWGLFRRERQEGKDDVPGIVHRRYIQQYNDRNHSKVPHRTKMSLVWIQPKVVTHPIQIIDINFFMEWKGIRVMLERRNAFKDVMVHRRWQQLTKRSTFVCRCPPLI